MYFHFSLEIGLKPQPQSAKKLVSNKTCYLQNYPYMNLLLLNKAKSIFIKGILDLCVIHFSLGSIH